MKAVLISIKSKWCKLIIDGKKTVEIRKTRPKIDTPFKCYIYCTKNKDIHDVLELHTDDGKIKKMNGKVIGEFVCDKIIEDHTVGHNAALYRDAACLPVDEAAAYCTQFPMYGWHISDLKIYDEPKKLSEFCRPCDPLPGCFCDYCETHGLYLTNMIIQRSPQSWRYVEGMKEAKKE